MTTSTFNARTLASEAFIEDLMAQTGKVRHDVVGPTRRHRPLNATFDTVEELFLGTYDSRGVGGIGVLINANSAMNIDSFEELTTRIGCLRLRRCGSMLALTDFVTDALTSRYDEDEIETFYMDLEKFCREDYTSYKVIFGDFNAKIGTRMTAEELQIATHDLHWNEQWERLSKFIMTTKSIHGKKAAKHKKRSPKPTINWDLFTTLAGILEDTVVDSIDEEYEWLNQHLRDSAKKAEGSITTKRRLSHEAELIRQRGEARAAGSYRLASQLAKRCRAAMREDLKERRAAVLAEAAEAGRSICNREDGYVILPVLPSEVRHAIKSVKNSTVPGPDRIRPEHLKNLPTALGNTFARFFTRYLSEGT
ncbi:hypothetical protein Y032_0447g1621 [Ancylostoma ceylanicum]|uniref:Endonuclease/exonuclease/phosphatase domain-containing protein n=1 Tax=Ancylostoma ceylanicum TaxID=53326 RepID=A0A016X0R8_9BILA|nr:hypothetical protein Y032_0447g1621 [Ancylostoma ceylanicum]